jgi:SAM-dependent methyltransferase
MKKMIGGKKDAFGLGLLEYMENGTSGEIIEREDGVMFYAYNGEYFTPYKKWSYYEKQAVKYAAGRVLDIGCGAGRHAIYLQQKGMDVLGIDNSPLAAAISRKRGVKNVKKMDIEEITPKFGRFGTILMLGNNFGLFQNKKKMKKTLSVLYKITTNDAVIIAESMDPHRLPGSGQGEYVKRNVALGRPPGFVRMRILIKDVIGPWFDYLYVSKKEMMEMLDGTPWRVKRFFGGIMPAYTAIIEKRR